MQVLLYDLLYDLMYVLICTSCLVFFLHGQFNIIANIILGSISKSENINISDNNKFVDIDISVFTELPLLRKFAFKYCQPLSIINSIFLAAFTLLTLYVSFKYGINTLAFSFINFCLAIINGYLTFSSTRLLNKILEEIDKFC